MTVQAIDGGTNAKTRHKTMTLAPEEFMRRFLLHVLPGGFHRIRHYGLLANGSRKASLPLARELLHVQARVQANDRGPAEAPGAPAAAFVCWHCGRPMTVLQTFRRGQTIRAPPQS